MSEGVASAEIPERFVPDEMRGQLVAAEHLARYTWACGFCRGKRVLDAGCGSGYGSAMLAQEAREVIAIDRSDAALELTRAAVPSSVICEVGDVTELRFEDDSFDVVVCFEVIEHVEQQDRVLDEFARVLRPGGRLIVSSPNRSRYVPGNPHHVHELTRDELQSMLDSRFPASRIYSQHVMLASAVTRDPGDAFVGVHTVRSAAPRSEDELYLLAVAGDAMPTDPPPQVVLGRFAEAREWLTYIDGLRNHIIGQDRRIAEFEDREAERISALAQVAQQQSQQAALKASEFEAEQLRRELAAAETKLAELGESHAQFGMASRDLQEMCTSLSTELATARSTIATMAGSRSWTVTRPLRSLAGLGRSRLPR